MEKPEAANGNGSAVREAPMILAKALTWDTEGIEWLTGRVKLPDGFVAQDLNDSPHVWKNLYNTVGAVSAQSRMVSKRGCGIRFSGTITTAMEGIAKHTF